jgi:3-methylfumaryl-CoA hydratase
MDTWSPVREDAEDVVTPAVAAGVHGLFDGEDAPPGPGDLLPALWHWFAFLPRVRQRDIGRDGHPRLGAFMPPVMLERRMFAGARLSFAGQLRVGASLRRRSTVASVEEKKGRSGDLVFVTVAHEFSDPGAGRLTEEQDIVYRAATTEAAPSPPEEVAVPDTDWAWRWDLEIDPTLLFRFSALTYNAHRIHYDRDYAMSVEGYPGLVVHGPLQAVALAELCRRHDPTPMATFAFRGVRPAFDEGPIRLRGRPDGDHVELAAFDRHGQVTTQARAVLQRPQ